LGIETQATNKVNRTRETSSSRRSISGKARYPQVIIESPNPKIGNSRHNGVKHVLFDLCRNGKSLVHGPQNLIRELASSDACAARTFNLSWHDHDDIEAGQHTIEVLLTNRSEFPVYLTFYSIVVQVVV
jgi:hypothetical protein